MSHSDSFTHFYSERGTFIVLSFSGYLHQTSIEELSRIRAEMLAKIEDKVVILNLTGVEGVSGDALSWVAQVQKEIRDRAVALRVCLRESQVKQKLMNMGLLRHAEWTESLERALASIPQTLIVEKARVKKSDAEKESSEKKPEQRHVS